MEPQGASILGDTICDGLRPEFLGPPTDAADQMAMLISSVAPTVARLAIHALENIDLTVVREALEGPVDRRQGEGVAPRGKCKVEIPGR